MLRANLYKKFSKSNLPKAEGGVDQPADSKAPYLSKGYMPTMFQMYEDSGLSAENFFKSNPLQNASEYKIPSTSSYGLIPKRNIYNPAYGNPGIYDAFFVDNQSFSRDRKGYSYPPRTHDLNTGSVQQADNYKSVPGVRQAVFCEGDSCLKSVRGENERAELLYNDLNNTYNDFKDKPERFQYFYDQIKKDGYLSNPFAENSSLRVRSRNAVQPIKVDQRNNLTFKLPSQNKTQTTNTPTVTQSATTVPIQDNIQLPEINTTPASKSIYFQENTGGPINFKTSNPFVTDNTIIATDAYRGPKTGITGEPVGSGTPLEMNQRKVTTPPSIESKFQANTSGLLNFNVPPFPSRNDNTGAPMGTTVQTDLNGNQSSFAPGYGPQNATQKIEGAAKKTTSPDYNSMFTLGLGAIDMGLGYNEDLKNQRILNESIQNRQSKPLYDYNYMYGRTTSGGTEYQPTIKAEMGAQITKRFNTPYGANNVEIEGGEFIQLPNFDTEHAEGPSHERGGIKTSLPEGTRVYSDHLKPEGSKKTFAQLAKKYDISDFKKVIDNPFRKQVDKDTATIMLKRNQKKLDDLFNDQQSMNGNSNGEMRDGGIHNPGFQALPKAVQDQIIANMEYGGYQLPEYGIGGKTFDEIAQQMLNSPQAGVNLLDQSLSQQILGNRTNPAKPVSSPTTNTSLPNTPASPQAKVNPKAQLYTKSNTLQGRTTPTGQSSLARSKTPEEYLKPWVGTIKGIENMTEGEAQSAIYDYALENNPESVTEMWTTFGNTEKGKEFSDITKMFPSGKISKESLTPEVLKSMKKAYIDNKLGARTLVPKTTTPTTGTTPTTPVAKAEGTPKVEEKATPPGFTGVKGVKPGNYNKMNFPLSQAIPNIYGLAESQSIFPYAIPEIDAPYLKPQTLNIQSQLQDIDNMGTAAVRAGADPLTSYLAGMDAKQKSFQTKQNYDAEGRSKADMFNAQGQLSADQMNASAFNSVYNQMIGQARDAQSAEKQAALANMVEKSAKHDQSENLKQWYFNNGVHSFDADGNTLQMSLNPEGMPTFNYNKPADKAITANTEDKKTKKGKKGMLVSKASSKKSLTKFK